jgi:sialic acid synthase SpsE
MIGELKKLNVTVGYSDHTIGIDVPVMSAAAGARIIEKHFTLDKNYSYFQDHKLSADPGEMREIVKRIKEISQLIGKIRTGLTKSEKENEVKVRRSLAAANKMKKGTIISEKDITWLRPGTGLPPGKESLILGKALIRDVEEGEIITLEDVS